MDEAIGFLALEETSDKGGYIGALLVTDDLGKPEEFRVTYPVKPTALQKQLYGSSLIPHIGVNLCGTPLFGALKKKPQLLILNDKRFLSLSERVDCSVVYLTRHGERLELKGQDSTDDEDEKSDLKTAAGTYQPMSVAYPTTYKSESKENAKSLLGRFSQSIDLLEPFERIRGALDALADTEERFR